MGRRPCPPCPAVCTVRPHGVWRSRQRRPEGARAARWATQGGRRWAWGAVRWQSAPMARSRLGGALRHQGLGAGLPRGGCRCPARAWLRPRTATVSPPRCRSPRWAADASSGLWAPPRRPGGRPVPPPRAGAHAPHPRRRPGLGSGGGCPRAGTARPTVGGRSGQARAGGTAWATRSPRSRRHGRRSRRRSARPGTRTATPCATARASGRAAGCWRGASGSAPWPTVAPPRQGRPTGSAGAAGVRPRRPAGRRSVKPPSGQPPAPWWLQPITRSSGQGARGQACPSQGAVNRRGAPGSRPCTPWGRLSVVRSMPGRAGWKSREGTSPPKSGSSIAKGARLEACDEWGQTPPRNSVECGKSHSKLVLDMRGLRTLP